MIAVAVVLLESSAPPDADSPPSADSVEAAGSGENDQGEVVLAPRPTTVAQGVHVLGGMYPSAVYAIETSEGLVLVDAGLTEEHAELVKELRQLGLEPNRVRAILLTHAHGDHSLGAAQLRTETGATIYAGEGDAQVLRSGRPRDRIFSIFEMRDVEMHATPVDVELSGGEMLTFGDTQIEAIATPGHTPGSLCYFLQRDGLRALFSGDTVMMLGGVVGTYAAYRAPRFGGDARAYLASLRKLSTLPAPDILLPGHPRDDNPPANPRLSPARWASLMIEGARELETMIDRYETDGEDFLDGQPKELLPGLHYLGDIEGCAAYLLVTPTQMFLIDAPGGSALPAWLEPRLRAIGVESRRLTAVLLTSGAAEAISGLPSLVADTGCAVVGSPRALEIVKPLCGDGAVFRSGEELESSGWLSVKTLPLADIHPGAMAYLIEWGDKFVLASGRFPHQGSTAEREAIRGAFDGRWEEDYWKSLVQLANEQPNLWLPAKPLNGRNANLYANEWRNILADCITSLERAADGS
ncbi:MAG TPA: MBL fold metallo-hydrolase [Pirellulales bacterium]|nr:MBL fold metallo-hydrolase [Pirellulales bacterium]